MNTGDTIFYGIIIIMLVILIIYFFQDHSKHDEEIIIEQRPVLNTIQEKVIYKHGPSCNCSECITVEKDFSISQLEFFDPNSGACKGTPSENLTDENFNDTNGGYSDYIRARAIGPDVLKNQAAFVKEIANPNNNLTGPTYSPDQQIENGPTNWIGILGPPQKVKVSNATQEPENVDTYPTKQAFRFGDGNGW